MPVLRLSLRLHQFLRFQLLALEDSMVAASVAPPSHEQRRHSACNFGVLCKSQLDLMLSDMFGDATHAVGCSCA